MNIRAIEQIEILHNQHIYLDVELKNFKLLYSKDNLDPYYITSSNHLVYCIQSL